MTILAVISSLLLILTVVSIFMGANFALDFSSTPLKFFIFQTIYRGVEITFCLVVLILAGDWDLKAWHFGSLRRNSAIYGALSVEYGNMPDDNDWEE